MDNTLQFAIPDSMDLDAIKAKLVEKLPHREEPLRSLRQSYYDTFDWRLYHDGGTLEIEATESTENKYHLSWHSLDSGNLNSCLDLTTIPRFVWDLPISTMRTRLHPIVEMRALIKQVEIHSNVRLLRLLNNDKKTVLRIVLEENTYIDADKNKWLNLGALVRIIPVKGYDNAATKILRIIEKELGLLPFSGNRMIMALAANNRRPSNYTGKLKLQLKADMSAELATKLILKNLLDTIEVNQEGTVKDIDSEFLHDFRVAIRRTRSALSQIKNVLPEPITKQFSEKFAWLGQVTGPTRDMDVYLLDFDGYKERLPDVVAADIEPLKQYLQSEQIREQKQLAKNINSAAFRKLMQEWRDYLESTSFELPAAVNAESPIIDVANKRISRIFQRVLKEGREIKPETPAEALHDLRKTCKKLRYLMEFFKNLYAADEITKLIKALKSLQENLGTFQDLQVQSDSLRRFSQQMLEQGKAKAETLLAMGMLIADLDKQQNQARESFNVRFQAFSEPDNHSLVKKLFASKPSQAQEIVQ